MLSNLWDFDASDILSVGIGMALALYGEPVYCCIRNKMDGKHRKIKLPSARNVLIAVGVLAIIWSVWSTNETQEQMRKLSFQTLQTAEAVCEEQKVRRVETDEQTAVFIKATRIPDEIRNLPQDDPVRRKWGQDLLNEYVKAGQDANLKRAELAKEFREHPRTQPKCVVGK